MDLIVNDLSMDGQFNDLPAFLQSIDRIMQIRQIVRRHQRTLYCGRHFASRRVTSDKVMREVVQAMPPDKRRAIMSWLDQQGPFWDDERQHDGSDMYLHQGEVVTDTTLGEAAYCVLHQIDRGLVSIMPSAFLENPIRVDRTCDDNHRSPIDITNHWTPESVEALLAAAPPALSSWASLRSLATSRFPDLHFSDNAFEPLHGHPFMPRVAERILERLAVLQHMKLCFDARGALTADGHIHYKTYFMGDKAWFSDSSDSEKNEFREQLTFPDPVSPGRHLFCTWHGKVKTPQYRVHFSWPITATMPIYVVYVGPKITRR